MAEVPQYGRYFNASVLTLQQVCGFVGVSFAHCELSSTMFYVDCALQ